MRMPNRTVYLPEDLDALSRHFELNLSQLTQEAIKRVAVSYTHLTLPTIYSV